VFRQRLIGYTAPWSLVGWPVVSVPCGFVQGLPVGLAFIATRSNDAQALRAAHGFQPVTDWYEQKPPSVTEVRGYVSGHERDVAAERSWVFPEPVP
jgi:Asp-tRNA(Asn)/Glu-tRNA(Gln) amidotransferase A subunit family amidase